jgi:ankyrin repeat protein
MTRASASFLLLALAAFLLLAVGMFFLWRIPHWGTATQSPLHSAVLADDLARAKALLPNAVPHSADDQLFYARSATMAEFLISSGASVNARAHGNYTPLHFAAAIAAEDVVAVLLRHGAEVNAIDDGKITPLMLAVGFGGDPDEGLELQGLVMSEARQLAVIRLLLNAGAKVDMRDSGGMTALGRATSGFNSKGVVPVLVEAGANVNAHSVDNITPLHGAAYHGDLATVRYLVEHGADITVKEWQGKTPLDCVQATGPDADEMRKLLTK